MANHRRVRRVSLGKGHTRAELARRVLEHPKCCLKAKIRPSVNVEIYFLKPGIECAFAAIDVWAAGIVLLCILGRCCNFFSSPDDVTALAEMITLFGMEAIEKLAKCCGKKSAQ